MLALLQKHLCFTSICLQNLTKMSLQAVLESHHCLHHISLVISEGFDGVENINEFLLLYHLTDAADGTESSRTPSASPVKIAVHQHITQHQRNGRRRRRKVLPSKNCWLWFYCVYLILRLCSVMGLDFNANSVIMTANYQISISVEIASRSIFFVAPWV